MMGSPTAWISKYKRPKSGSEPFVRLLEASRDNCRAERAIVVAFPERATGALCGSELVLHILGSLAAAMSCSEWQLNAQDALSGSAQPRLCFALPPTPSPSQHPFLLAE